MNDFSSSDFASVAGKTLEGDLDAPGEKRA